MFEEKRETGDATADVAGELVVAIVTEIARLEAVQPQDIRPPLATVVDTDALGSLVAHTDAPLRVTFEYLGYEVSLVGGGGRPDVFVRRM